ncbi:MAG TPA: hypothetical protein VGH02_12360 [Rhizomicrobium sp.]|jgi:hypothetical protein
MSENFGDLLDLAPDKAKEEPWSSHPDGGIIWVGRAKPEELPELYALTQREVGEHITSLQTLQNMQKFNRDTVWGVYRASDQTRTDKTMVGYVALIFLNKAGLEALEESRFDGIDPDMRMVVPSDTRPEAIYMWVVVLRKVSRIAGWLIANALGAERYGGVPIFATAGTTGGLNALKGRGFVPHETQAGLGNLFRMDRPPYVAAGNSNAA